MGITLRQVDSLAGGIQEGYMQGQANRRDNAENERAQAGEDRTARDDAFGQAYNKTLEERNAIDERWRNGGGQAPEQAPGQAAGGIPASGLPTGGEQMGPPVPPPSQYKSRREEMDSWRQRAEADASRLGGLEGLQLFRDNESALNRKQMLAHGTNADRHLAGGQAGEAAKELNTALALSPEDMGVKWVAEDGKLYLTGEDDKLGEPYTNAMLRATIDGQMTTPENYKAMQEVGLKRREAREKERAALEKEATDQQKADASTSTAKTYAAAQKLDELHRDRETAATEANALANLISSKASYARANALAEANGWSNSDRLRIMENADSWSMEDQLLLPGVSEAFKKDPEQWNLHKADVMNQMLGNQAEGGPVREEASMVSQFLREPAGSEFDMYKDSEGKFKNLKFWKDEETGAIGVVYNSKEWRLPYALGEIAAKKMGVLGPPRDESVEKEKEKEEEMLGGGGKEEGLPTGLGRGRGRGPVNEQGIPIVTDDRAKNREEARKKLPKSMGGLMNG